MTTINKKQRINPTAFLIGGGEMGERMLAFDWSKTPLGPLEEWPQSLLTSVSICLNSEFPIGMVWGSDLTLLYNDAFIPILGSKHPHQALGKPNKECFHEIWSVIGPMQEGILKNGKAIWSEDLLLPLQRSGYLEECYFTFSYSPIRDESANICGVFVPVKETTEKVITGRRLSTLRELAIRGAEPHNVTRTCEIIVETLYGNPYDFSFVCLYLYDTNSMFAKLAGAAGIDVGTQVSPLLLNLQPEDSERHLFADALLMKQTKVFDRQILGSLPEGVWETTPEEVIVIPLNMGNLAIPGGALIVGINARKRLDIEYRRFLDVVAGQIGDAIAAAQTHEEEQKRSEELAELDRRKNDFLAMLSHELRNPLAAISNSSFMLSRVPQGSTLALRAQATIESQLQKINRLIDDLLDVTRITQNKIQLRHQLFNVNDLVSRTVEDNRFLFENNNIALQVKLGVTPIMINADSVRIMQVISNLLQNASKFSLPGGLTRVIVNKEQSYVTICIIDDGIGIEADLIEHVFEPFVQANRSLERSQGGLGLGLALAKDLVELHGGNINVSSKGKGKGTAFTVKLPIDHSLDTIQISEPQKNQFINYRNVLIIDDNVSVAASLSMVIEMFGHTVHIAYNGSDGIQKAQEIKPDIILCDIGLPGMNGYQVAEMIKGDKSLCSAYLIALSGYAQPDDINKSRIAGFDIHLAKPPNLTELEQILLK